MSTITIVGNLVRDPELRFTPTTGRAVANLTVAENHRRRTPDGAGWEDLPIFYWPVTVWGEQAEHLVESLTAGTRVVVVGRTRTTVWTPSEGERAGQEQRRLEVVAEEVTPSLRWATATVIKTGRRDGEARPLTSRRSRSRRRGPRCCRGPPGPYPGDDLGRGRAAAGGIEGVAQRRERARPPCCGSVWNECRTTARSQCS